MIDGIDLIATAFLIWFLFTEHYILATVLTVVGLALWVLKEGV